MSIAFTDDSFVRSSLLAPTPTHRFPSPSTSSPSSILHAPSSSTPSPDLHLLPLNDVFSTINKPQTTTALPRLSDKRLCANRLNAQKSTGPKTPQGKRAVSRNALKHGRRSSPSPLEGEGRGEGECVESDQTHVCPSHARLGTECSATFQTFLQELERNLCPNSALHRILFNEIANLSWNLRRNPHIQKQLFSSPARNSELGTRNSELPCVTLATAFQDSHSNPFTRQSRYERSQQSMLTRLLRLYLHVQKTIPSEPHDPNEPPVPREGSQPAWRPSPAPNPNLNHNPNPDPPSPFDLHQLKGEEGRIARAVDRAAKARQTHLIWQEQDLARQRAARATSSSPRSSFSVQSPAFPENKPISNPPQPPFPAQNPTSPTSPERAASPIKATASQESLIDPNRGYTPKPSAD